MLRQLTLVLFCLIHLCALSGCTQNDDEDDIQLSPNAGSILFSKVLFPEEVISIELLSPSIDELPIVVESAAGQLTVLNRRENSMQIRVPDPVTFGDRSLMFNEEVPVSVCEIACGEGNKEWHFEMKINQPSQYFLAQITERSGIYLDYSDVQVGDHVLARFKTGAGIFDAAKGQLEVTEASVFDFWIFGEHWSDKRSVMFSSKPRNFGSMILPPKVSPSLPLLDLDLTKGNSVLTGSGFSVVQNAPGSYWDEDGFHGNNVAYIRTDNFPGREALVSVAQGYFYIEVEREALSRDQSSSTSVFFDSTGSTGSEQRYLLWTDDGTGKYQEHFFKDQSSRLQLFHQEDGIVEYQFAPNSHTSQFNDQKFAEILVTWSGSDIFWYMDGSVIKHAVVATPPTHAWKRIYLGVYAGSRMIGDYAIRRVRIGTDFFDPRNHVSDTKIGVLGDSFVVAGSNRSEPNDLDAATVGELDGLQSTTDINDSYEQRLQGNRGAANWVHQLQSRLLKDVGFFYPVYNGGSSGNGWLNAPRSVNKQIPEDFVEAVSSFDPEVIVMLGSVNDLWIAPEDFDVAEDIKIDIDFLINNTPSLKKIILVQTFGWYHPDNQSANTLGWLENYEKYNTQLASLDGYRGIVKWVTQDWGAEPPDAYLIGSSPANITATSKKDFHPSATGHTVIADMVYPALFESIVELE